MSYLDCVVKLEDLVDKGLDGHQIELFCPDVDCFEQIAVLDLGSIDSGEKIGDDVFE